LPVCRNVRLAVERAVRDREAAQVDPAFAFEFNEARAEKVCRFLELFPHTKGRWAAARTPFVLEPWQAWAVCELFGWVRKKDGLGRFRKALVMLPRKAGKAELAARIALYMLAADGEHGAEVYSGATTERQAMEVFRPALQMAQSTPAFLAHYSVTAFKQSI